ncbi:hypothetical protein ACPSM1_20010 [Micromonospora chersina]|uniref:hypothetical protein n=1 Tax=Micromonospora chersina TaxID=47854 RepID=UPI003C9763D2
MAAADVRLFERAVGGFGAVSGDGKAFLGSPGTLAFVASEGEQITVYPDDVA